MNLIKQNSHAVIEYSKNRPAPKAKEASYKKDLPNILFLMFLYLLQGVPIGLSYSLPFLLSAQKVSYTNQSIFSLSGWPYSMKLLWAPFIDSFFNRRIGRRKSWLVPVQYLIGTCMLVFASYVHNVLETERGVSQLGKIKLLKMILTDCHCFVCYVILHFSNSLIWIFNSFIHSQ